jgi:hypothetical protein
LLGLIVTVAVLAPPPAALAQSEVFTVHNVAVDATAEDATTARDAAIAEGHKTALDILLDRLVPVDERAYVPPVAPGQIVELVQDFSVESERSSDVRYLADLTFRFNPDSIRRFLRDYNVSFAEAQSEPVLVLPVFGTEGQARLWEEPNPWRHAWSARNLTSELVPMIVPLGDLDDVALVTARQALDGDLAGLESVARRYGAEDVLVGQMLLSGDAAAGGARAVINGTRYSAYASKDFRAEVEQQQGESQEAFLDRAVKAVAARVQGAWKQANLLSYGQENSLMATVPVRSVSDWIEVKRRLDDVPLVLQSEAAQITRSSVEVLIVFMGGEDQLARTLAKNDLVLIPDQIAGWWQLSVDSAAPRLDSQPIAE